MDFNTTATWPDHQPTIQFNQLASIQHAYIKIRPCRSGRPPIIYTHAHISFISISCLYQHFNQQDPEQSFDDNNNWLYGSTIISFVRYQDQLRNNRPQLAAAYSNNQAWQNSTTD